MKEDELEQEILKTLSFFDKMGLDQLFLDLDPSFVETYKELTYQDLLSCLTTLETKKKVKLIKSDKFKFWIKVYPKRSLSLIQQIKLKLKSFL